MTHSPEPAQAGERKSWKLLGLTFVLWAGTICLLGPNLLAILSEKESVFQLVMLSAFAALLVLFWLLGAYFISVTLVHCLSRTETKGRFRKDTLARSTTGQPPVAILYPTCDDFQREAVLTCLAQDYPEFRVFILDDSRDPSIKQSIDAFRAEFASKVVVIRRPDRRGFKAGNLNFAVRGPASDFPIFAVMDADERIPVDFLSKLVPRLEGNDYAFVQASHAPNPEQRGAFAAVLGQSILPFWSVLLPAKNRFGFVPCVGHGVLVRRTAWDGVGGFPEVASEDLAFSAALLEKGLRGCYAADVVCLEDFPSGMPALRKQQERYVAGVFQSLLRYWPKLLFTSKASWVEKCDFALGCLPIYIPVLCFLFIMLTGVGIPLATGGWQAFLYTIQDIPHVPLARSLETILQPLWETKFAVLSTFVSLSPCFLLLTLGAQGMTKSPWRTLALSNLAYISTMTTSCFALVKYAVRLPIPFEPTGKHATLDGPVALRRERVLAQTIMELAPMMILVTVHLTMLNVGFATVAATPILGRLCARHMMCFESIAILMFALVLGQTATDLILGFRHLSFAACVIPVQF